MNYHCHTNKGARLVYSVALVRVGTRINLACVKKRQGCNYTEMEGQRDGTLFATAWTLLLRESEKRICLLLRKETALHFCPFVSPCVLSLKMLGLIVVIYLLLMATLLSSLWCNSLCLKVNGRLRCTQKRDSLCETDDKRWLIYKISEINQVLNWTRLDMLNHFHWSRR